MGHIFITSDTHFGHTNVLKYCNRPFASIDEHDDELIRLWNVMVGRTDTVFHLGDFAFSLKPENILRRLNGYVHLILGNHDDRKRLRNCHFASVRDVFNLKVGGEQIWLSHYAHRRWPKSHHGAMHCYGHSHGNLEGYGRSMDVGVDTNSYSPYAVEDIIKRLSKKELTPHHDD